MEILELINLKKQGNCLDLKIKDIYNRIFVGDNPFLNDMKISVIDIKPNPDIECLEMIIDYNKYLEHNELVIINYLISKENSISYFDFDTMLDSSYNVDKDLKRCSLLIDLSEGNEENPFELITENPFLIEYQEMNFNGSYIEFLENELKKARIFK